MEDMIMDDLSHKTNTCTWDSAIPYIAFWNHGAFISAMIYGDAILHAASDCCSNSCDSGECQSTKDDKKQCACPLEILMTSGCRCGAFAAEMSEKRE
jgi:hypothetical protein